MNNRHHETECQRSRRYERWLAVAAIGLVLGGGMAAAVKIQLDKPDVNMAEDRPGPDMASPRPPLAGWKLHGAHQRLGSCDTGLPPWAPGGATINMAATARLLARNSATADDYAIAIRAHVARLAADGSLTAAQASSLDACLSPTETASQYASWRRRGGAEPAAQDGGANAPDQAGADDGSH